MSSRTNNALLLAQPTRRRSVPGNPHRCAPAPARGRPKRSHPHAVHSQPGSWRSPPPRVSPHNPLLVDFWTTLMPWRIIRFPHHPGTAFRPLLQSLPLPRMRGARRSRCRCSLPPTAITPESNRPRSMKETLMVRPLPEGHREVLRIKRNSVATTPGNNDHKFSWLQRRIGLPHSPCGEWTGSSTTSGASSSIPTASSNSPDLPPPGRRRLSRRVKVSSSARLGQRAEIAIAGKRSSGRSVCPRDSPGRRAGGRTLPVELPGPAVHALH